MSRYQEAVLGMSEWERWQGGYEVDPFTALEMPRVEDDETYGDDGPTPPPPTRRHRRQPEGIKASGR